MSKTGFLYTCAGILSEDESKWTEGKYLGSAATFSITTTTSDVKDYGDNGVVETDTSVTGGTVNLELNDMEKELYAFLLGHTVDKSTGEIAFNAEDISPFVGIGAVGTSTRSKAHKYIGKFYHKVQFKEPNDENTTKQENVTFSHTSLEGNLFVPEEGLWKEQCEFDTLAEAKEWLNKKVGITAQAGA
jgi:phi13 family phage major tail protein